MSPHGDASPSHVPSRSRGGQSASCHGRELAELHRCDSGVNLHACSCAGKLVSDAAAAAGVKVFVFSTLEDVEKRSQARVCLARAVSGARALDSDRPCRNHDVDSIRPAIYGILSTAAWQATIEAIIIRDRCHLQGKYVVNTFTDKARIEEYIKQTHGRMIGIFPAVAGFYTNWVSLNAPRYIHYNLEKLLSLRSV